MKAEERADFEKAFPPERFFPTVRKLLPDGRHLQVAPLTYGRARLTVSQAGDEDDWYLGW